MCQGKAVNRQENAVATQRNGGGSAVGKAVRRHGKGGRALVLCGSTAAAAAGGLCASATRIPCRGRPGALSARAGGAGNQRLQLQPATSAYSQQPAATPTARTPNVRRLMLRQPAVSAYSCIWWSQLPTGTARARCRRGGGRGGRGWSQLIKGSKKVQKKVVKRCGQAVRRCGKAVRRCKDSEKTVKMQMKGSARARKKAVKRQ